MPDLFSSARMPVVFVSHGSPMVLLDDDDYTRGLARVGRSITRPRAIVVISAHYEAPKPIRVTSAAEPKQIFDFSGFPAALYGIEYRPKGAPGLAAFIAERLAAAGLEARVDEERGLDHGVWAPLHFMFPSADIPVIAISLTIERTPANLLAIGRTLAPLRNEGVLIVGSGGVVHNLRAIAFDDPLAKEADWALEFDRWVRERVRDHDRTMLARYRELAPHAERAVPTSEHFDPLFVVLGCLADDDGITDVYRGFRYGSLSMQTFIAQDMSRGEPEFSAPRAT